MGYKHTIPPDRTERLRQRDPLSLRGSGAMTPLTDEEARLSASAIDTFVTVLGGRDQLTEALQIAIDEPEVDQVVTLLLDPRYDHLPLRRICQLASLTVADLFAAYKKAMIVKAHVQAYQRITDKLLPVVEDVMRRAAPFEVGCGACGATGQDRDAEGLPRPGIACPTCAGRGRVLQLPDLDRQKLALELGALLAKSAGISVVQTQQTLNVSAQAGATGRGTLEAVQQAVGELFGQTPLVVDAEEVAERRAAADPPADPQPAPPAP